ARPECRATTGGQPAAAASAATMPNASGNVDGTTHTSARFKRWRRWRCSSGPVKRTRSPSTSLARFSSAARSSPNPPITSAAVDRGDDDDDDDSLAKESSSTSTPLVLISLSKYTTSGALVGDGFVVGAFAKPVALAAGAVALAVVVGLAVVVALVAGAGGA